ncbi:MAG: hypothetical protein WCV67_11515 [Victivallaceae bacterium]
MINLTTIRNSALALAMGLLLFAEFLHPAFHNHATCSRSLTGGTTGLAQGDFEFTHAGHACLICSSMFLKYCANVSSAIVICNRQDIVILLPPDFIFIETNLTILPRAPPVFS